jgi:RimJ/RimL family protein N-acetyltransferase
MATLETPRLLLRSLKAEDASTITREINKFHIVRNLARVPFPYGHHHADEFIAWANTLDDRSAICAVELKSNPGTLIGVASHEWSDARQNTELGYWYAEDAWGNGYATEAGRAVAGHAFDVAGHETLISYYHNDNPASGRVLTKIGFEVNGSGTHFSLAHNCEVPITAMRLTRDIWRQNTRRT